MLAQHNATGYGIVSISNVPNSVHVVLMQLPFSLLGYPFDVHGHFFCADNVLWMIVCGQESADASESGNEE